MEHPAFSVTDATRLDELATDLQLPNFDLLLMGDGSGTVYREPAGWACLAYDRRRGDVRLHLGGMSCGTNNAAELLPFLQALWYHDQTRDRQAATRVVVISH
jgi:hypothetical protein